MEFQVDLLLKGEEHATTHVIRSSAAHEPPAWTDEDVTIVLKEMLAALDHKRNPGKPDRPVFLRGISWIVDPYDQGGVLIALEIPTGAAVAGPFAIARADLEASIARVMAREVASHSSDLIH
jgi:hypothetical protein